MKKAFLSVKSNILEESLLNNKKLLRKHYIDLISKLPIDRKKEASKNACLALERLSKQAKLIASFTPLKDELDIWPFNDLMMKEKKLLLPAVTGKDLAFFNVEDRSELILSQWNVLEPKTTDLPPAQIDAIDFIIIPGLAFDRQFYRLGKGKGYYDYFIAMHQPKHTIGVAFKEQQHLSSLVVEPHDQKLSEVLFF